MTNKEWPGAGTGLLPAKVARDVGVGSAGGFQSIGKLSNGVVRRVRFVKQRH